MNDGPEHYAPKRPPIRIVEHFDDRVRTTEPDPEAAEVAAATAQHVRKPVPPPDPEKPTDKQRVAYEMDHLRHLDLRAIVDEMFGELPAEERADRMHKMAEWAASNNHKGTTA